MRPTGGVSCATGIKYISFVFVGDGAVIFAAEFAAVVVCFVIAGEYVCARMGIYAVQQFVYDVAYFIIPAPW